MNPFRPARAVMSITPSALRTHLSTPAPQPLHLRGLIDHWPARTTWSLFDHLKNVREAVGEDREVEIELGKAGRGYLDKDWQRISMGFGLFLDGFIFRLIPSSSSSSASLPTAYLAQSDLLDTSPRLAEAVPPLPHFTVGKEGNIYRRTLWIGPEGSWTPFHKDPYIGIYSQIIGKKTFHLLPPEAAPYLNLSPIPRHANTSQIPIPVSRIFSDPTSTSHEDLLDLPPQTLERSKLALEKAAALPGSCQVDLQAGDSVLVPQGWWHAAEGVGGPGVGVGAWFR